VLEDPHAPLRLALRDNDELKDRDFKAPMSWDPSGDKEKCCGIVKDVLAFANTDGGLIIIGVNELDDGTREHAGLSSDELRTWDETTFNQFLQNYADPPIDVRVRKFQDNNKHFIALDVAAFSDLPHFCKKASGRELKQHTLYVRTNNKASEPIGSSADFNAIIERAVRNRSERLLTSVRSILVGASIEPSPLDRDQFARQLEEVRQTGTEKYPSDLSDFSSFREVAWWPARFQVDRFPVDALVEAIREANKRVYRSWPFLQYRRVSGAPHVIQDGIMGEYGVWETFPMHDAVRYPIYGYWELRQSGFLYQHTPLPEDALTECIGEKMLFWEETAIYIAEAVDCLGNVCGALAITDEDVTLRVGITGSADRTIGSVALLQPIARQGTHCVVPEVVFEYTHSVEDWLAGRIDLATAITYDILLRFNWESLSRHNIKELIVQLFEDRLANRSRYR